MRDSASSMPLPINWDGRPSCLLQREVTASSTVLRHIPVPVFVLTTLHDMQSSGGSRRGGQRVCPSEEAGMGNIPVCWGERQQPQLSLNLHGAH